MQYEIPAGELLAFNTAAEKLKELGADAGAKYPPRKAATQESFPFDPNTVSGQDLQRLGLSEKQAASFLKYRERAPFRQGSDLEKLYVLSETQKKKLVSLARVNNDNALTGTDSDNVTPDLPGARIGRSRSTAGGAWPDAPRSFVFDPNTVSADSLRLLGLSKKQAAAFVKYRDKAAFSEISDIGKLFVLKPDQVEHLVSLARLTPAARKPAADERAGDVTEAAAVPPSSPIPAIDINTASATQWQTLPGIGAYRADRIVKFRDLLGGFTDVDQVGTTYGMPDSAFQNIRPYLRAGPLIKKIDINRIDATELARHPYLKLNVARVIVRYRDNHGPFTGPDDLKKVIALTDENLARVLPYLNFDL